MLGAGRIQFREVNSHRSAIHNGGGGATVALALVVIIAFKKQGAIERIGTGIIPSNAYWITPHVAFVVFERIFQQLDLCGTFALGLIALHGAEATNGKAGEHNDDGDDNHQLHQGEAFSCS